MYPNPGESGVVPGTAYPYPYAYGTYGKLLNRGSYVLGPARNGSTPRNGSTTRREKRNGRTDSTNRPLNPGGWARGGARPDGGAGGTRSLGSGDCRRFTGFGRNVTPAPAAPRFPGM